MAQLIQSLERGLRILEILGKSDKPLSLGEITQFFDIDKSSIFRLLSTLTQNNFVYQDAETKKYMLGFKIMELSGAFGEQTKIETFLRPVLKAVCDKTRQNTHLAILHGQEVVFIAVEQPRNGISMHISVGTREPVHATALGKVLIAFAQKNEQELLLQGISFTHYTPHTIVDGNEYRNHLISIVQNRYAVDDEEYRLGVVCIAAPVFNHRGEVEYSIGISGPKDQITPHIADYITVVQDAGAECSRLLGMSSR
ncbi:MAG TPA: IclR family transcriptional regulator [Spirochaetota bacterium]|nr:IclR family transcriptional regulator [Spirochaetota bacterium]